MPATVSPILRVLREMRDDIHGLRGDIHELREGATQTNQHVDRIEIRLATELRSVAAAVLDVRDLLARRLDQRDRVDDHERRLCSLERKAG